MKKLDKTMKEFLNYDGKFECFICHEEIPMDYSDEKLSDNEMILMHKECDKGNIKWWELI